MRASADTVKGKEFLEHTLRRKHGARTHTRADGALLKIESGGGPSGAHTPSAHTDRYNNGASYAMFDTSGWEKRVS